jgi:uncharacterized membrane protein
MNRVLWRNRVKILPFWAAAGGGVERFWDSDPGWLFLWIALLLIFVTIAWYISGKIRPKTVQKEQKARQWLFKFSESHSRGELSDEEFRTIKTTLATRLQDELRDNGEKG